MVILVVLADGTPVKQAWVEVSGMGGHTYLIEGHPAAIAPNGEPGGWLAEDQVTDSRGLFVVEVEPGLHTYSVTTANLGRSDGSAVFDAQHTFLRLMIE